MTLKSLEIKNFLSSRVSTILISFLVASASCHLALPHIIRPMLRVLKFIPMIIFQSPEFDRTIFFSKWFSMPKKSVQSSCHWVRLIWLSSWFNINPCYFTKKYIFCRWASEGRSSWFCFSLWTACACKYFRLQRKYFRLRFRGLLLVVVVLFVDQVRDQPTQAMRNSDPRVRIVFVYRFNSNFHSIFTLQITGCDFQHGSNIGVPSNPNFRVSWFFISWQSVLTTCHWFCNLWELVSVLLSWSTLRLQYKSSSLDLVVEAFPLVPCASAIDFLMQEFQSKVWVSLSISLLARKVDQIALPQQVSLFLFDKYCIPHTNLRLLRRYWADWQKWLCEKQNQSYHAGQNDYRYRSEIKSKTIGLYQITDVTDLY